MNESKVKIDDLVIEETIFGDENVEDLKIIAFSNIYDFIKTVGGEMVLKPLSEIEPEKLKAVKEMKNCVNPDRSFGGFCIEMHDRGYAMTRLGQIYGLLEE
ncbi:MAG: hypothetical protein ACQ9MH_13165 [Nitrospinales bacterium]